RARSSDGPLSVDDARSTANRYTTGSGRESFRTGSQNGAHLGRRQIGSNGEHERNHARDHGSGETRPLHPFGIVAHWNRRSAVSQGKDKIARLPDSGIASRCADRYRGARVAVARLVSGVAGGGDRDHSCTIRWRMVDGVIGLVASGYDDGSGHAMRQRSVDDRLRVLAARTHVRIAEAHVDDMGGMRICGGPGDTQSGGPGDAVENVGEKPATL